MTPALSYVLMKNGVEQRDAAVTREHREAIRQPADERRRLLEAEVAVAEAQAAAKHTETAFDSVNDRFAAVEATLDAVAMNRRIHRSARGPAMQSGLMCG